MSLKSTGVLLAALGLAGGMIFHFSNLREQEAELLACERVVEKVQAAVDQYRLDHEGEEPAGWGDLIPDYLGEIPVCPRPGFHLELGGNEASVTCSERPRP
ncbi:MAG TPA: hypothetical protein PKE55_02835 [Kiritimatiellia bacterium]|nr:hypothetical protein [Kiritimatiellia bacterium]